MHHLQVIKLQKLAAGVTNNILYFSLIVWKYQWNDQLKRSMNFQHPFTSNGSLAFSESDDT